MVKVRPCHFLKVMTLDCLFSPFSRAQPTQIGRWHSHFRFKTSKGFLNLLIALHDFELIAVVKFQRCLQGKEMFLAVIAFQKLWQSLARCS